MEMNMKAKQQGIQSIEVGVRILRVLANNPRPMGLKEIAAEAGTTLSNTHRYLVSLVESQLARQDEFSGRYTLGSFALQLGLIALERLEADEIASRAMAKLRNRIEKTVFLSLWADHGPTIVRWQSGPATLGVSVKLGQKVPLLTGTSGRVFLAYEPWDRLQAVIQDELEILNKRGSSITMDDVIALREEIRGVGLSRVLGEAFPGIFGLSAPIFNASGELAMVISTVDTEHNFDASFDGEVAQALREVAAEASWEMGFGHGRHNSG